MPVKSFTSLDVINFVTGYLSGPSGVSPVVTAPDFGTLNLTGSGSSGTPGQSSEFIYRQTASLDYNAVGAIPDGVVISRLVVNLQQSYNISASANNAFNTNTVIVDVILPTLLASFSSLNGPPASYTNSQSAGPGYIDQVFSPPISKADLIASYADFVLTISSNDLEATGPSVGTYSIAYDLDLSVWSVDITYAEQFTWDLEIPDDPVDTGTQITVTSDSNDPTHPELTLDVSQITSIELDYTDENGDPQVIPVTDIITRFHRITTSQIINLLVFRIPDLTSIGTPPGVVRVVITSTEFGGSVELGKLITIYFVNAPGIYRLVANKHTDTLYDVENGGTVEVKIPDPFAKIGFVGN